MKPSKKSEKLVHLSVESGDPIVEIFVIDGQFNLTTKGVGGLEADLPPGLYKVKFKAGSVIKEVEAILDPGTDRVTITAPVLDFSSPAPIPGTRTVRTGHMEQAHILSREIHGHTGRGGQLFLFVRDLEKGITSDPSQGLSLLTLDGERLFYLNQVGKRDLEEQWAGGTIELAPGIYRLHLQTRVTGALEQTVVISPGWQTQVFLMRRSFGKRESSARRADLTNASVFMSRLGEGFQPERPDLRWTELARMELGSTRCIVPEDQIEEMLEFKKHNPILALFCAHMLLNGKDVKTGIVRTMVKRMQSQLGEHPDVNALVLRLAELEKDRQVSVPPYKAPPMLRSSWNTVVKWSASWPDLVPARSLSDLIAAHLWGSGPWLVWQPPEAPLRSREKGEPPELSESIPQIEDYLSEPELLEQFTEESDLNELEQSLLRYVALSKPTMLHSKGVLPLEEGRDEEKDPFSNDSIIKALGVPNPSARKAAAGLIEKLEQKRIRGAMKGRQT
jgi:hypothetical protein